MPPARDGQQFCINAVCQEPSKKLLGAYMGYAIIGRSMNE